MIRSTGALPAAAGPSGGQASRPSFGGHWHRALEDLGLRVCVETDLEAWTAFIRATEWPVVNAVIDPAYHDFTTGEACWLRLSRGETTVATQVLRSIVTDDYVGMVRDHSLFFGSHSSGFRDFRMLAGERIPKIGGSVAHLSGLYIRPAWRRVRTADGLRLVAAWTRLTHSFTTRALGADWSVSLIEGRVATRRLIADLYGYPNWSELFEAYEPALGRFERVTLVWMSAVELAESVASRPR